VQHFSTLFTYSTEPPIVDLCRQMYARAILTTASSKLFSFRQQFSAGHTSIVAPMIIAVMSFEIIHFGSTGSKRYR
jgi:hypothetical protein